MTFRNLLLLTIVIFGLQTATEAQTVPEVEMPLITKVTASWCPNCGTWGWTLFEGILEDDDGKAIILNTHFSGDLTTTASQDFANNLNANGQPIFYFNNENIMATSNTVSAKRQEMKDKVNNASLMSPLVNTGIEYTLTDNTYSINTKTKFFSEMTGNIHLSIVALESKVSNIQAALGVVEHTYVIRGAESSNTFGPLIASGTNAAGTEIDGTYTLEKADNWNADNITLVALLWSEDNENFNYLNGSVAVEAMTSGLSTDLSSDFNAEWRTSETQNELFIRTAIDLGTTDISIFNVNGQKVSQLFQAELFSGEYHFPVDELGTGTYFIEIQTAKGTETIKAQF